jgi:DNA-binding NtrC family response regulator
MKPMSAWPILRSTPLCVPASVLGYADDDPMVPLKDTREDRMELAAPPQPRPGALVVFSGGPLVRAFPLDGSPLELGRDLPAAAPLTDDWLSRRHAIVARTGERWTVRDLDSRNGTFVDGARVRGEVDADGEPVVRIGRTLLLLLRDVRPFLRGDAPIADDGVIAGATLRRALDRVARAARLGDSVLVTGESGSGKEVAARMFHRAGPYPDGPFVAVNCAAIPEGIAERLLFGSRKGAYSGASDAPGYIETAAGGTLFLDEIGELELAIQAKLLRVLEAHELLPLGATRSRPIELRVVAATNRDLRAAVTTGRMREDLFYRLGKREVRLPALRSRREDIPWLIDGELARLDPKLSAHAQLVEECCLRAWPGNVRELLAAVRQAGEEAATDEQSIVVVDHLAHSAGMTVREPPPPGAAPPVAEAAGTAAIATAAPLARKRAARHPTREEIEDALRLHGGNMTAAARELGVHRTQLYRMSRRFGIGVEP